MSKLSDTICELVTPVGEWSVKNFPMSDFADSILGIQEEMGEFSRAVLKAKQGIRGSAEKHRADGIDALCDAAIYAMDAAYRISDIPGNVPAAFRLTFDDLEGFIGSSQSADDGHPVDQALCLGVIAGEITQVYSRFIRGEDPAVLAMIVPATVAFLYMSQYVGRTLYGIDLSDEIRRVWAEVQQRDWTANPINAHVVAAEAAVAIGGDV